MFYMSSDLHLISKSQTVLDPSDGITDGRMYKSFILFI